MILNDPVRFTSAASLLEVSMVLLNPSQGESWAALDRIIRDLRGIVVPVDEEQALAAREAFRRFGKGRHPAKLNFGDCFWYALAKVKGQPSLFKDNDFSQTDLLIA